MFWKIRDKKVESKIISRSEIYVIDTYEEICFAIDLVVDIGGGILEERVLKSPSRICLEDVKVGDISYSYKKYK
jgi:hypothetical protein